MKTIHIPQHASWQTEPQQNFQKLRTSFKKNLLKFQ